MSQLYSAEVKDGKLCVDLYHVFQNMPDESKKELINLLTCESVIIKSVIEQVLDGWNEDGYGAGYNPGSSTAYYGMDWAKRQIAKHSSEIAKNDIEGLEKKLKEREDELQKIHEEAAQRRSRLF